MKNILCYLTVVLFATKSSAQLDSIYAKIKITSISFKGKPLKLSTPKILTLTSFGTTEITSLGIINGDEIGLQFELLKSSLGNEFSMVSGKGYFFKRDGVWEMIKITNYQTCGFKVISDKSNIYEKDFSQSGASVEEVKTGKELSINYWERYYIIK